MTLRADFARVAGSLVGRVVVVAGTDERLPTVVSTLAAAGAFVASVAPTRSDTAQADFRADPADPAVWERVAPHIEQRLGPVDAVVVDRQCAAVVRDVFLPDLRRRGHGGVHVVTADQDVAAIVRSVEDML